MNESEIIDLLEEIAGEVGGDVRYNYSGRGMYGKTCVGIVCEDATKCIEEAAVRGFRGAKTDSMGRDTIVYWPKIAVKQPSESEEN